jgi:nucleotide-binding universal stress UspA family protein
MYQTILAAVNEYSNSEAAARYAIGLAQSCKAKLILSFVAEADAGLETLRHADAALERLFMEAGAKGLEVETIIRKGDPYRQLNALVREKAVDLIFLATRREDVTRRYFTRTLARRLMLHLPCSVALVRVVHPGKIFPRKILVPFRGRPPHPEEKAFFVAKLAQAFGAAVTVFHAPEVLTRFFQGVRPLSHAELEKHVPPEMNRFMKYLEQFRLAPERRLGQGRAGRAITIEAALQKNDLIIMGASERGLLESMLGGNPVEEVLRETPCNLIVLLTRAKRK